MISDNYQGSTLIHQLYLNEPQDQLHYYSSSSSSSDSISDSSIINSPTATRDDDAYRPFPRYITDEINQMLPSSIPHTAHIPPPSVLSRSGRVPPPSLLRNSQQRLISCSSSSSSHKKLSPNSSSSCSICSCSNSTCSDIRCCSSGRPVSNFPNSKNSNSKVKVTISPNAVPVGWWMVMVEDEQGYAPASYLEPVEGGVESNQHSAPLDEENMSKFLLLVSNYVEVDERD